MNIHEFEAYARATIPVPTGVLIITQKLHTGILSMPPTVTWSISHFATGVYSLCTLGEGSTPEAALANLIPQLIPCTPNPSSTASPLAPPPCS